MIEFLPTRSRRPHATLLLAHGSGVRMNAPFMTDISEALAANGVNVLRFEFAYMTGRASEHRRPPELSREFRDALNSVRSDEPVFIGGKSMGARIACMIAEDAYRHERIAGVVCLGYPFHAPSRPDLPRTAELATLTAPTLICQGTRDPFGTREQVSGYDLSGAVELFWLEDGDHDFKPGTLSDQAQQENFVRAAKAIARWTDKPMLPRSRRSAR